MFLDLEHGAVSGPAVPQIGQRDAEEMAETVSAGVVTVVVAALTVQSQVPFPWGGRGKAKKRKKENRCQTRGRFNSPRPLWR